MGIEKQGSNPSGIIGSIFGKLMNKVHTPLYIKYFNKNKLPKDSNILDIGCGGGGFLNYLSRFDSSYNLTGVDHSSSMIDLSKVTNKSIINEGRLELKTASVDQLPFQKNEFDVVTACETIQFWTNIDKSLSEVCRVLNANGRFIIINRFPKEGTI